MNDRSAARVIDQRVVNVNGAGDKRLRHMTEAAAAVDYWKDE